MGGAAGRGASKSHEMKGMHIGRGSAGHARRKVVERQPKLDAFSDVGRACKAWLLGHGEREMAFGDW
jgi:hypothetical protein